MKLLVYFFIFFSNSRVSVSNLLQIVAGIEYAMRYVCDGISMSLNDYITASQIVYSLYVGMM